MEWLSDLFVTERTKLSNFDTSSRLMYSIRVGLDPKKMACIPRITGVLKIFAQTFPANFANFFFNVLDIAVAFLKFCVDILKFGNTMRGGIICKNKGVDLTKSRHSLDREPPLPVWLKIYTRR